MDSSPSADPRRPMHRLRAANARASTTDGCTGPLRPAATAVSALCLLSAIHPAALRAQPPPPDSVLVLDSLEVSILRSPTARGRVPYAVDVAEGTALGLGISGAFLEEALDDLVGVRVQNRFNFAVGERLAVRGFGSRAQFGIRGVKVLVDGIPATMPDGQSSLDHLDLATLGQAEVLRGPGSSLYGNAAGGVLALRTRPPFDGDLRQDVKVVAGSHGLLDLDAITSGTLGGTGYVAGFGRLEYDGFRGDPTREDDATYGAADRMHFNGQISRDLGPGRLRLTLNLLGLDAENPGSIAASDLSEAPDARTFNVVQRTGKELNQHQIGASWEGPAPGGTAEVALWGIRRSVLNPIPPTIIDLDRRAGGARFLLRGGQSDGAGALRWSSGLEIELQHDDRRNFTNEEGEATDLTLDQDETVRATGAFGRLALGLAPGVELSAALRYDRIRFEADDDLVRPGNPDDSGERILDAWSPSVGLVAEPAEGLTLWGNVATSLETPTTTEMVNRPDGGGGFNPELDAQRTTGLEAGARGLVPARLPVLPGAVSWEVTVFRAEITDELVPFEVPSQAGRTFFRNAGSSLHEGVEASVRSELGSGLQVRGTWTLVNARYESFEVEGEDFSGNRVPGLAPHRVQGVMSQQRPGWFWAAEIEWSDEVPVDDAGQEAADAHTLTNLRAGLRDLRVAGLGVSPFAAVSNVFDESYVAAVTVNAFGDRYYEPGPGRTLHVGATLRWDRP